ncbi:TRAP transporter substrate-binding protein [Treponema socranskii]|uniref:ABC transporter, substrate-binding protein, family 7 n=1 Tax=Treponema socranskii subsp. socranskii VPI DR56BR1116 = ATCC 35536 TaxID=1125725 RepID=U2L121_TRESO|nr:TRAP transporter substrate-binding protein [Treponema socranskii]ERF60619.1 ABC transporter, substrate-binding protein, family 7 [Treponema socranskii subsp. socranskii VPI DR56BR1116 = ATCC 35536]ERK04432.1 ABC transporter, substrate-binding protein, family 7 [Treponema socranskii subsp. socranskii VPI DR56BR1116 = ATCC 35536]MDR9860177.1 TRAP transporter substrate-binding protein [Treponema socranskii]
MKKFVMALLVGFLVVFSASSEGQKDSADKGITLNIQHNLPISNAWQGGFEYIKEQILKKHPNTKCTIYPNGQLAKGDWKIIFEQTQSNVVQMTCESQVTLATLVPELFALSTPFLFDDMNHLIRFMETEPEYVKKWFAKLEDNNLKVLVYWPRGPRQLLNSKRPIISPADIAGLKFRVPGMDLFITTFEAMGAKPVPLPSGEIYTAMQLGTVAGEDNSLQTIFTTKTFEQGKYFNVWNYMADGVLVVVNKTWYDNLPADFRADLDDIAKESTKVMLELINKGELKAREEMAARGIKFTDFTTAMKKPWIDRMGPVYASVAKTIGEETFKKLKAGAEATRQ